MTSSLRTTSIASSSSAASKRIPMTPEVWRPIGRSCSSSAWKRIDMASRADQQQIVGVAAELGGDELVALTQVDRREATGAVGVVRAQLGLLDQSLLGGDHQVRRDVVIADRHHLGDPLIGLERQDVGDVLAPGRARLLRQLMRLGPVDPAPVGEEQQPVVGRGDEEVLDDVVLAQRRALHAPAAPLLRAVEVGLGALGVAAAGHRDHDVFVGDQVLEAHVALERDEPGTCARHRIAGRSRRAPRR